MHGHDKPSSGASVLDDLLQQIAERIATPRGYRDLSDKVRFAPTDGRIWLGGERMALVHVHSLATLRHELIETLGTEKTRGLLTRMGYVSGAKDAELVSGIRKDSNGVGVLAAGLALHGIEGLVSVEPLSLEFDVAKGLFEGKFLWHDSAEVDAHLAFFGPSSDPVCWIQVGYACGYASRMMGKPVLFREVECRAMGHECCRVVGKTVDAWEDPAPDINFLRANSFNVEKPASAVRRNTTAPKEESGRTGPAFGTVIGTSSGFVAAGHLMEKVSTTDATVLFLGETGVGKEVFARAMHRIGHRAAQPFLAVNCTAIPDNLVEAELFGVEKGAFTGAVASRPGRFERANKGTLFLDEVGHLPFSAQGKLLRVLQEGEVERVGDTQVRKVDVRIIAATNVDLKEAVERGEFRQDLWFRLNVFPIRIPPLRERRDDIPLLMDHFLCKYRTTHTRNVTGFTERAVDALLHYNFPGNIRELENMIERAVILAPQEAPLDIPHLFSTPEQMHKAILHLDGTGGLESVEEQDNLIERAIETGMTLQEMEARILRQTVEKCDGNLAEAARQLGLTRPQLAYRYRKLTSRDSKA